MTLREQIVTIKIQYEDGEQEVCDNEEECCGPGNCSNRGMTPETAHENDQLVYEFDGLTHYEILQISPDREVINENTFKE